MSTAIVLAKEVHRSISNLIHTVDEAFEPLVAFWGILDEMDHRDNACVPGDIAVVIEALTEKAKSMLEGKIQAVLEQCPVHDKEAQALEQDAADEQVDALEEQEVSHE